MPTHAELDYRPLTAPVSRTDLGALRRWAADTDQPWSGSSASQIVGWVIGVFVGCMFAVVGGFVAGFFLETALSATGVPSPAASILALVIVVVILLAIAGAVVAITLSRRRTLWTRRYRLFSFARANGLAAVIEEPNPGYPGAIFGIGSARAAYECIRSAAGRFLEIGSYRYTTGSGKNRSSHAWGYLAMRLDRRLPQMVLDSRANNGLFGSTNLPEHFSRNQVLSLEGDFDDYFTLYCPREYEQDALYIFTPDLMALLIDNAGAFDVEIVDDWMFVYQAAPLDTTDPAVLSRMFHIVDTVGAKTLSQSERYRDDQAMPADGEKTSAARTGRGTVAPRGRRLKTSASWVSIAVFAAVGAWWVYASFFLGN